VFTFNPTSDSFVHEPNRLYIIDADGARLPLVFGRNDLKGSPEWWPQRGGEIRIARHRIARREGVEPPTF
jgi:hypothetical protein